MSHELEERPSQGPPHSTKGGIAAPYVVYLLYVLSLLFGVTAVAGVIIAYIAKRNAPAWLASHYRFQIGTFWIGLLLFGVAIATTPIFGIGVVVAIALMVWLIIRCGYGLRRLGARRPIPVPETWWFGWQRNG